METSKSSSRNRIEELERQLLDFKDENRDLKIRVAGVNVLSSILKTTREDLRLVQLDKDALEDQLTHVECRCTILEREKYEREQKHHNIKTFEPAKKVIEALVEENNRLKAELDILKKAKIGLQNGKPDVFMELYSFKDDIEGEVQRLQRFLKTNSGLNLDQPRQPYDSHPCNENTQAFAFEDDYPIGNTRQNGAMVTAAKKKKKKNSINNDDKHSAMETIIEDNISSDDELRSVESIQQMKEILESKENRIKLLERENAEMSALNAALMNQIADEEDRDFKNNNNNNNNTTNDSHGYSSDEDSEDSSLENGANNLTVELLKDTEDIDTQTEATSKCDKEVTCDIKTSFSVPKQTIKTSHSISKQTMTDMSGYEIDRTKLKLNLLQFDVESEKNKASELQYQLDELQTLITDQPSLLDNKSSPVKIKNEKALSKSATCIPTIHGGHTKRRIVLETDI